MFPPLERNPRNTVVELLSSLSWSKKLVGVNCKPWRPWAVAYMYSFWSRSRSQPSEPSEAQESQKAKRYSTSYQENVLRTEKSRAQIRLNRLKRKCEAQIGAGHQANSSASILVDNGRKECGSFIGQLQKNFLSKEFSHAQYQDDGYYGLRFSFANDRARAVCALIQALAATLNAMFDRQQQPFHAINCHCVDDTSTRMRGPNPSTDPTTVYTIMNSVQSIHVHYDASSPCYSSFQIPTPLLIVENANAAGIDKACMSTAVLTSGGAGELLRRFGVNDAYAKFKTYVFIGDSLQANNASFQRECERLARKRRDPEFVHHLALRVRCAVHAVCLVRKPIVLVIPRFWTTLVRLSHLFETVTFRKQLAASLTKIICESFVHIQCDNHPPEMAMWREKAVRLKERFWCVSVRKREALSQALDFFNGDLTGSTIMHYCKHDSEGQPCCKDYNAALTKALKCWVPWLSSGYPVPLLYRFKHYDAAAGFVHIGVSVHQLLIRALSLVDTDSAQNLNSSSSEVVDKLLGYMQTQDQEDWPDLSDLKLDQDESYQQVTFKRKQLVKAEVCRPSFPESTVIINTIIAPMEGLLDQLFKRSERLSQMTVLGQQNTSWQEMASKSKSFFLDLMSGRRGWSVIDAYCTLLNDSVHESIVSGELSASTSNLQTIWTMVLICITDTWRRFIHDYSSFPHILFGLIETDIKTFCDMWDSFQSRLEKCEGCFDNNYSKVLLQAFPSRLSGAPPDQQQDIYHQVVTLLGDVATFAPLSSDPVECKNGRVQWFVSRRGNQAVKAPVAAREGSFLQSSIQTHELLKHFVDGATLPSKRTVAGIIRSVHSGVP